MAYIDHIDPGNSGGSISIPSDIASRVTIIQPLFECTQCGQTFSTPELLSEHSVDNHPLHRPYLLINSHEATRTGTIIYEPLTIDSVILKNFDTIVMDDMVYSSAESFINNLICSDKGRRNIKLFYRDYSVEFNVIFDYLSNEDVLRVEQCFYQVFTDEELSKNHLDRFDRICRDNTCMNRYAGGLGCYITGLLARERNPTSSLPFENYPEKFGEALDKLTPLKRPLAEGIVSTIQFSQNQFDKMVNLTVVPQIYAAAFFLKTGYFIEHSFKNEMKLKKFPIDRVTERLIAFLTQGNEKRNLMIIEMESYLKRSFINDIDKNKIRVALLAYYRDTQEGLKMKNTYKELKHNIYFSKISKKIIGASND